MHFLLNPCTMNGSNDAENAYLQSYTATGFHSSHGQMSTSPTTFTVGMFPSDVISQTSSHLLASNHRQIVKANTSEDGPYFNSAPVGIPIHLLDPSSLPNQIAAPRASVGLKFMSYENDSEGDCGDVDGPDVTSTYDHVMQFSINHEHHGGNGVEYIDYGIDDLDDGDGGDDDPTICTPGSEHTGRWTRKEHELFLEALKKYGREWKKVASMVKTRTVVQTRTHAQKYFQKFMKGVGGNAAFTGAGSSEDELVHEATISDNVGTESAKRSGNSSVKKHRRSDVSNHGSCKRVSLALEPEHREGGAESIEVHAPAAANATPPLPAENFPVPSPAACGKRKQAELTAAQMLASSSTQDMEGAQVLSMMRGASYVSGDTARRHRVVPSLSIINPDTLPSTLQSSAQEPPETPWDSQMRDLESRSDKDHGKSTFSVSVATPSDQKTFMGRVRECVREGHVKELENILHAAQASTLIMLEPSFSSQDSSSNSEQESYISDSNKVTAVNSYSINLGDATNSTPHPKPAQPIRMSTSASSSSSKSKPFSVLGRSLNRLNSQGRNILLAACAGEDSDLDQDTTLAICRILLHHGCTAAAAVEASSGMSCLHFVALRGYEKVGRMLLTLVGSLLNSLDSEGNTALHIAAREGHGPFVEMLIDFGANCHIRNCRHRSALDVAASADSSVLPRADMRRIILSCEPRLRTLILFHEDCLEHSSRKPTEWEGPDRLVAVMQSIKEKQEFPEYSLDVSSQFEKAKVELLERVHSPEYIAFVDSLSKQVQGSDVTVAGHTMAFTPQVQKVMLHQPFEELKRSEYCDTSFSAGTLRAARRAAGAVAHAVDHVLLGRHRNAFCVVRPPGHHAGYEGLLDGAKSCGFCIFNSVAAGALHALESHNCERVAIIDLDIHHGNGTEDIVRRYSSPSRLFFFSLHLFERDESFEFFPGSGACDDMAHNIINVPLTPMWQLKRQHALANMAPQPAASASTRSTTAMSTSSSDDAGTDDAASTVLELGSPTSDLSGPPMTGKDLYRQAVVQRLLPALRAFNPSLVLISMGFDPAAGDVGNIKSGAVERGMDLEPVDFEWVTTEVMKVADMCCGGRVVSVLEGGYGEYGKQSQQPLKQPTRLATRSSRGSATSAPTEPSFMAESGMNRDCLAISAAAHVARLVDPYGPVRASTGTILSTAATKERTVPSVHVLSTPARP